MRLGVFAAVMLVATSARAELTLGPSSTPYTGIRREVWIDSNPTRPVRLTLLRINLTSSEIALYATKEADSGITTREYAARVGAQIAINGGAFMVNGYAPRGLARGDFQNWANTGADDLRTTVFYFQRVGERTIAVIEGDSVVDPLHVPEGVEGLISGRPLLVRASHVATDQINCADPISMDCQLAPRSAIGISPDGNMMWLVTVDGWQSASAGMTLPDLAQFLVDRGAGTAMALDGGSSSTLVLDGNHINAPSDGVERRVANHLAVKFGALPKGVLFGFICKHTVTGCGESSSMWISGATVILDDNRVRTTGSAGSYEFLDVTPRYACVTVKKTGWLTAHKCDKVMPGTERSYNSVALVEGTDPPDAGVGADAGLGVVIDAAMAIDAQTGDGGNGYEGPGGGCACNSRRDHPSLLLVAVVAWFPRRRRGTTA
jgi:hypothetical protein